MEEENKYDVYIDGELEFEDIEASSEEEAIEIAQELYESDYNNNGEETGYDVGNYKWKAVRKL
jgi:hypothetical protein